MRIIRFKVMKQIRSWHDLQFGCNQFISLNETSPWRDRPSNRCPATDNITYKVEGKRMSELSRNAPSGESILIYLCFKCNPRAVCPVLVQVTREPPRPGPQLQPSHTFSIPLQTCKGLRWRRPIRMI